MFFSMSEKRIIGTCGIPWSSPWRLLSRIRRSLKSMGATCMYMKDTSIDCVRDDWTIDYKLLWKKERNRAKIIERCEDPVVLVENTWFHHLSNAMLSWDKDAVENASIIDIPYNIVYVANTRELEPWEKDLDDTWEDLVNYNCKKFLAHKYCSDVLDLDPNFWGVKDAYYRFKFRTWFTHWWQDTPEKG